MSRAPARRLTTPDREFHYLTLIHREHSDAPTYRVEIGKLPQSFRRYFATSGEAVWKVNQWLKECSKRERPILEAFREELEAARQNYTWIETEWQCHDLFVIAKDSVGARTEKAAKLLGRTA